MPQLAAIRANAKVQASPGALPAHHPPPTREPEAWWQLADFELAYDSSTGWQLTHQHYPAGSAQPIPVESYPTTSDRLRRNVITAQKAAGAAIEDLTGRRIQGWGDDEDGAGDPYWSAHLHQADPEINP